MSLKFTPTILDTAIAAVILDRLCLPGIGIIIESIKSENRYNKIDIVCSKYNKKYISNNNSTNKLSKDATPYITYYEKFENFLKERANEQKNDLSKNFSNIRFVFDSFSAGSPNARLELWLMDCRYKEVHW